MIGWWVWLAGGVIGLWALGAFLTPPPTVSVHPCLQSDEWAVNWMEPPNHPTGMDFDTRDAAVACAEGVAERIDASVEVADEHPISQESNQ